jgi:hypothetical protein
MIHLKKKVTEAFSAGATEIKPTEIIKLLILLRTIPVTFLMMGQETNKPSVSFMTPMKTLKLNIKGTDVYFAAGTQTQFIIHTRNVLKAFLETDTTNESVGHLKLAFNSVDVTLTFGVSNGTVAHVLEMLQKMKGA